jgi:hypothetical protein
LASPNPEDRHLIATLSAHQSWGNTKDRPARTKPARDAFDAKFLTEAEGDPKRAESLRKAHFTRLALKSAQARRRRKAGKAETAGSGAA